jgi:hypothetical protein
LGRFFCLKIFPEEKPPEEDKRGEDENKYDFRPEGKTTTRKAHLKAHPLTYLLDSVKNIYKILKAAKLALLI